jgi:hypothetical protein
VVRCLIAVASLIRAAISAPPSFSRERKLSRKFVAIYHAKAEDFQKATERVYRSGAQTSEIKVIVVK